MTTYILPAVFIIILGYALFKKIKIFDAFLAGAKQGASSCLTILPALVGLVVAVSMMRASGLMDFIAKGITPALNLISFPADVLPLALLKSVSGSGALALIKDIFQSSGVDSISGRLASVMLGSSETTFYALAVYFGATSVRNTRYTVFSAVVADVAGIIAAVVLCNFFW